jgi:hypothetical protein
MSEITATDGFKRAIKWPDPTPEMIASPEFEAIWNCIKSWDINVPAAYGGYMGATGNHVRAILDALQMDKGTVRTLLDLLNPLHGSLDRQTYDEKAKQNFDAPGDFEYAVNVTAQQERDLTQAVLILENRRGALTAGERSS